MQNAKMDPAVLVKKYGMTSEDIGSFVHLNAHGRLATTLQAAGLQLRDFRVRVPGQSVGIGDVIIPQSGSFIGIPLLVAGFGGRQMKVRNFPGIGVAPSGWASYLVVKPFYSDGCSTGIRIKLPLSDRNA